MIFYAYRPTLDGREPTGTESRILRHDLKSAEMFVRSARRLLGPDVKAFAIRENDFYRGTNWLQLCGDRADAFATSQGWAE